MATPPIKSRAVPAGRIARLAGFGRLAGGLAGAVIGGGARTLARGQRPDLPSLLLTPANARRLADELARLRGAAMKLGQLMSMDSGDLLPPELAEVLARLRADAEPMPERQLRGQLDAAWGPGWEARLFQRFQWRPIAAASIGQVHRATMLDGRDVAIKVQYPGVRASIDADVDNVATLVKLSGLVPAGLDLAPLLGEAKRQLHEEADYLREGDCLARFGTLLAGREPFVVPGRVAPLSTADVLVMDHVAGVAIEGLTALPQAARDAAITALMQLLLAELFEFGLMQTDPNFANYRYRLNDGAIILLDFGATRAVPPALAAGYRAILRAGIAGDHPGMAAAMEQMGVLPPGADRLRDTVLAMADEAFLPLRAGGHFDFGASDVAQRLAGQSRQLASLRAEFAVPPADLLFIQRKFGGMYLLASRLKARVAVAPLIARWLAD